MSSGKYYSYTSSPTNPTILPPFHITVAPQVAKESPSSSASKVSSHSEANADSSSNANAKNQTLQDSQLEIPKPSSSSSSSGRYHSSGARLPFLIDWQTEVGGQVLRQA